LSDAVISGYTESGTLRRNDMATAKAVKRKHEARLMRLPGVVGVAIGRKEGRDCICVYVAEDDPKILAALPRTLEEIPVEIIVSGIFTSR
jgi:hypothetical protein